MIKEGITLEEEDQINSDYFLSLYHEDFDALYAKGIAEGRSHVDIMQDIMALIGNAERDIEATYFSQDLFNNPGLINLLVYLSNEQEVLLSLEENHPLAELWYNEYTGLYLFVTSVLSKLEELYDVESTDLERLMEANNQINEMFMKVR